MKTTVLSLIFAIFALMATAQTAERSSQIGDLVASSINLYPNPLVGETFKVSSPDNQLMLIEVRNLIGQLIYRKEQPEASFEGTTEVRLNTNKEGIYFVKLDFVDAKTVIKKLVIKN